MKERCFKSKMIDSPKFASLYFLFFGMTLAIGSFVFFVCALPSCPSGCECSGKVSANDYVFPIIWLLQSGAWLGKAEAFLHVSNQRASSEQDHNVDTEVTIPYNSMI
jgi:hypothetical protein